MNRIERYKNIEQEKLKEEKEERKREKKEKKKEKKHLKEIEKQELLEQGIKKKSKVKGLIKYLFIIFIISLSYAYFIEPNLLLVHDHVLKEDIPESFHGLKIIHFSDIHYGMTVDLERLEKIVEKINRANPDFVLFTGDFVDRTYTIKEDEAIKISAVLKSINTKYGKYAVLGNHDPDNALMMNLFYDGDFKLLKDNYDLIYIDKDNPIAIYGIDNTLNLAHEIKIKEKVSYTIILSHIPDLVDDITHQIDANLILSGHSHNGQVKIPYLKPFMLPKGSNNYYAPYYLKGNTKVYISNGIGTSVLPLRFSSIPSFNVYRLIKNK